MKKFENPVMDVEVLNIADVIATSEPGACVSDNPSCQTQLPCFDD